MCISPQVIKYDKFQRTFGASVPCGNCYECVRRRKLDWEIRLTVQSSVSTNTFFGMLTFNDEYYHSDVDHKELQYYFKRLRYNLDRYYPGCKLKYFLVSEFGELKNRLHYHVLYFLGPEFTDTFREFQELCKLSWVKKVSLSDEEISFRKQLYKAYMKRPRKERDHDRALQLHRWSRCRYEDHSLGFATAQMLKHGTAVGSIHYACKYIQKQYNRMFYSKLGYKAWVDDQVKKGLLVPNWNRDLKDVSSCFVRYLYESKHEEYPTFPIRGKLYPVPKRWCQNSFGEYYTKYLRALMVKKLESESLPKIVDINAQYYFEHSEPERMARVHHAALECQRIRSELFEGRNDFICDEVEWQPSTILKPSLPCQGDLSSTYPIEPRLQLRWLS